MRSLDRAQLKRIARPAFRAATAGRRDPARVVSELVGNRIDVEPELRPDFDAITDEQARLHFGVDEPLESEHHRRIYRFFHAWRVARLRERLGDRLARARMLDVGDTDGLILKSLGKSGIGFNLSNAALANIRSNGIEAVGGDGHGLPFEDEAFDVVLCFETLEHVESPHQVLEELSRVTAPGGRVFISIPWVPRTTFHPRDESVARGYQHICELSQADFRALVSHSSLAISWEDVCWVTGPPKTVEQRLFLAVHRGPTLAWTFRGFQFYELEKRT